MSTHEAVPPPLTRQTRAFIVLAALLQGLLMWLAETGLDHGWWPFAELGGRVCWYTLVLGVPSSMTLSILRIDDRRFWQHAALIAATLAVLAAWAAWSATGAPGIESSTVLAPYGLTTIAAVFIALPWLQCRLHDGRWQAPYADLFEHAWQNGLTLLLAGAFVAICWGVLTLWAELFALVDIRFYKNLFAERPFVYLATGGMAGLGILIGRTQQRPIRIARQIVFAVFAGLLPLLACIAVLFAASLLFTGLTPLWNTRSATKILMALVGTMVLFTNAVFQDGAHAPPYARWLQRVIDAGLLVLPVHACIGLYALFLRIHQYGWTSERYWATVASVVLTAYAFGYAIAVLRRGQPTWLATLRPVNCVLSLVVIGVIAPSNSLLLDPHRLSVNDQIARWSDERTDAKHLDLEHLRFESGRRGYAAALALRGDARVVADELLADKLKKLLARKQRYEWRNAEQQRRTAITTRDQLIATLRAATGSPEPEEALVQALLKSDAATTTCRQESDDCVYIARDVDGDGSVDALICELVDTHESCQLWDRASGEWIKAAQFDWWADASELQHALRSGEVTAVRKRWPDLKVAEKTAEPQVH